MLYRHTKTFAFDKRIPYITTVCSVSRLVNHADQFFYGFFNPCSSFAD